MFTNLPNKVTPQAIKWVIDSALKANRKFTHIRVPRDKNVSCSRGKSTNLFEVSHISLQQVLEVVGFDLRNSIFALGNQLFFQKSGVPMGGYISSAEAIITCAFSEHQ